MNFLQQVGNRLPGPQGDIKDRLGAVERGGYRIEGRNRSGLSLGDSPDSRIILRVGDLQAGRDVGLGGLKLRRNLLKRAKRNQSRWVVGYRTGRHGHVSDRASSPECVHLATAETSETRSHIYG